MVAEILYARLFRRWRRTSSNTAPTIATMPTTLTPTPIPACAAVLSEPWSAVVVDVALVVGVIKLLVGVVFVVALLVGVVFVVSVLVRAMRTPGAKVHEVAEGLLELSDE